MPHSDYEDVPEGKQLNGFTGEWEDAAPLSLSPSPADQRKLAMEVDFRPLKDVADEFVVTQHPDYVPFTAEDDPGQHGSVGTGDDEADVIKRGAINPLERETKVSHPSQLASLVKPVPVVNQHEALDIVKKHSVHEVNTKQTVPPVKGKNHVPPSKKAVAETKEGTHGKKHK